MNVTKSELFDGIVNSEIIGLKLIYIKCNPEPFGIKLIFDNDYIISMPISDNNTVETKEFNKNDCIKNFKHLGKVIFSEV